MTDLRRLKHKIARLADSANLTDANGRSIDAAEKRDRLLAVLQEIDETILPSTLTFSSGVDDLVLEVANRRVLKFNGTIVPEGDAGREMLTTELDQAIEGLFAGASAPSIKASKLGRQIGPDEIGCSSTVLAKAWGIDPYRSASDNLVEKLDTFMEASLDLSSAWLRRDGQGIMQKSGPDGDTKRLATLVECDLSAISGSMTGRAADTHGACCAILGSGENGTKSIAYVKAETSLALVMIASEDVPEFNALWQSHFQ